MSVVGRPTKYKPEYCQMLIDHLAIGHSFESFCGLIDVDETTIYLWARTHKEFSLAKNIGKKKGLLALERMGFAGMAGKIQGWNPTTWIFYMKNMHRHLYNDQKQIEITAKPMVIEKLNGDEVVLTLEEGKDYEEK